MSFLFPPFPYRSRAAAVSRQFVRAVIGAAVLVLAPSRQAPALQWTDVAGTINGDPITVADVDRAAGGQASDEWRVLGIIARNAARALCTERIHQMLAESEGVDLDTWKARLWQATESRASHRTEPADKGAASAASPPSSAEHEAHVRAYRQRLASSAERILERELAFAVPAADQEAGEPQLPDVFASCLGRSITRGEIESYAAYPLYERRTELVTKLCDQFEIAYDKPLVVGHVAAAEGKTLDQLLAKIEGDLGEIPEEEVRRVASERYGSLDDMTLLKARLALDGQRREDRRRAWLEKVRRETQAQCALTMPPQPESDVRAEGIAAGSPSALTVYYFGNFDCPNCGSGWQMLRTTGSAHADRVRIVFLHHFPEADAELFSQALEAECAAQQGRFGDYGDWRTSPVRIGSAADSVGLDSARLQSCVRDARTAVRVLDDTAEALRLGFREAVPSWVIGRHVRRGIQGQSAIDRDIAEQLARPAPLPSAPAPAAVGPQSGGVPPPSPTAAPAAQGAGGSTKDSRASSSEKGAPASGALPSPPAQTRGAARGPGGGWR